MKTRGKKAPADGGLVPVILDYLATQRDVWAERRNAGSRVITGKGDRRYFIYLGESGTPDITGYVKRPGAFAIPFGIEAKAIGGELSEDQIEWHAQAAEWGIPVLTTNSVGTVREFIQALRRST